MSTHHPYSISTKLLRLGINSEAHSESRLKTTNKKQKVVVWHTLFDELELRPETVGAQRLAPDSM
ncbi:hypothetical protein, partial [Coleofasciculus sp. E2-BRE-01]|uniref:hypothetical protein n=1 Tax=Coleofasciculus sp. E2-BRE-01 TaxID=3069524 RepID=UPI0032F1356E